MTSQQEDIANFDYWANDAEAWILHARGLHLSATLLRKKFTDIDFDLVNKPQESLEAIESSGLPLVAAMLQGFAIEAYLKAFYIRQGHAVAKQGRYSIPSIQKDSHDLPSIADGVGFTITDTEREALSRLSLFVSSYGRYPITKRWQQAPLKPDTHGISHRVSWSNDDHATAETIIARLEQSTRKAEQGAAANRCLPLS